MTGRLFLNKDWDNIDMDLRVKITNMKICGRCRLRETSFSFSREKEDGIAFLSWRVCWSCFGLNEEIAVIKKFERGNDK